MRFWTRELAGWLLVFSGLYVFYLCYELLTGDIHYVIEGGALTLIGIIIFRGGIHLLKVATAARACLEARQLEDGGRSLAVPADGTARSSDRSPRGPALKQR